MFILHILCHTSLQTPHNKSRLGILIGFNYQGLDMKIWFFRVISILCFLGLASFQIAQAQAPAINSNGDLASYSLVATGVIDPAFLQNSSYTVESLANGQVKVSINNNSEIFSTVLSATSNQADTLVVQTPIVQGTGLVNTEIIAFTFLNLPLIGDVFSVALNVSSIGSIACTFIDTSTQANCTVSTSTPSVTISQALSFPGSQIQQPAAQFLTITNSPFLSIITNAALSLVSQNQGLQTSLNTANGTITILQFKVRILRWSKKLDRIRSALRRGDIKLASKDTKTMRTRLPAIIDSFK